MEALNYEPQPTQHQPRFGDDIAYVAPMAAFLLLTAVGAKFESWYPAVYTIKTVLTAGLLWYFRKQYTPISWRFWWLGVIVGVIGIVQWVGMQLWLQRHVEFFRPSGDAFNPFDRLHSLAVLFIVVRITGAVLVVPVMEELFWRDFLWRTVLAPNDFKLASVGERGLTPFLIVAGAFATVHGNWWLTAIVWAMMIGLLLIRTKSLGACIVAHAVTNLLLACYVLHTHDWAFW
jgi:CAAX prenyl protease-like protein